MIPCCSFGIQRRLSCFLSGDSTLSQLYVCVLISEQPNQISLLLTGVADAYYTTLLNLYWVTNM